MYDQIPPLCKPLLISSTRLKSDVTVIPPSEDSALATALSTSDTFTNQDTQEANDHGHLAKALTMIADMNDIMSITTCVENEPTASFSYNCIDWQFHCYASG